MSNIYDQHRAAFANVSAYVIIGRDTDDTGNPVRVATIAFKYPRDGAGRLYAYVHFIGCEMVRGFASGGGYDKHSAACASAAELIVDKRDVMATWAQQRVSEYDAFRAAISHDDGNTWHNHLLAAGFTVIQAV